MSTITLEQGVAFCRLIEPILAKNGHHCALTGSILFKGESKKDIDVMIYPHQRSEPKEPVELLIALTQVGVVNQYRTTANYHDKDVWVVRYKGVRVDLFFMEGLPANAPTEEAEL